MSDPATARDEGEMDSTPSLCSAPNLVKVGRKGRHLPIPEGWELITHGEMQAGDLVANIVDVHWEPVDAEDPGLPWNVYDFLIRKQNARVQSSEMTERNDD
mgnify:CR=1 FL=1